MRGKAAGCRRPFPHPRRSDGRNARRPRTRGTRDKSRRSPCRGGISTETPAATAAPPDRPFPDKERTPAGNPRQRSGKRRRRRTSSAGARARNPSRRPGGRSGPDLPQTFRPCIPPRGYNRPCGSRKTAHALRSGAGRAPMRPSDLLRQPPKKAASVRPVRASRPKKGCRRGPDTLRNMLRRARGRSFPAEDWRSAVQGAGNSRRASTDKARIFSAGVSHSCPNIGKHLLTGKKIRAFKSRPPETALYSDRPG